MLILGVQQDSFELYHLEQVRTSGNDPAMALVKLSRGDQTLMDTAVGDGPVHAACMAVERIVGVSGRLQQFEIRATTPGKDALGEAYVMVSFGDRVYRGNGASTDIIEAAISAYVSAVNKYVAFLESQNIVAERKNGAAE